MINFQKNNEVSDNGKYLATFKKNMFRIQNSLNTIISKMDNDGMGIEKKEFKKTQKLAAIKFDGNGKKIM